MSHMRPISKVEDIADIVRHTKDAIESLALGRHELVVVRDAHLTVEDIQHELDTVLEFCGAE